MVEDLQNQCYVSVHQRWCQYCSQLVNLKGIASHERGCKKRQDKDHMNQAFEKAWLLELGSK